MSKNNRINLIFIPANLKKYFKFAGKIIKT